MRDKTFRREIQRENDAAERRASDRILEILKNVNKVYLGPVTMEGGHQVVKDCLFWDCKPYGICIKSAEENLIIGNLVTGSDTAIQAFEEEKE